jgi:hypothetical protein
MDKDKMIRLFLEEQRQQELRPSEIAALAQSLVKEERAAAEARRRANLKKGTASPEGERFPVRGRSLDRIGKHFGVSGRTLRKIVEMAEGGFGQQMNAVGLGRVNGAYRRYKRNKQKEERQGQIITPVADDGIRLFHCRFQALEEVAGLKPVSANLFLTDILYEQAFLPQVDDLGRLAQQALVEGGLLVLYTGQAYLNRVMASLDSYLTYRWTGAFVWGGDANIFYPCMVTSQWKPILVYSKGAWHRRFRWPDVIRATGKEKDWHEYQQPLDAVEKLVSYFSKPGDLVVDPCGGGFTTAEACLGLGRRCISCDIDGPCVERGRQRLEEARERMRPKTGE